NVLVHLAKWERGVLPSVQTREFDHVANACRLGSVDKRVLRFDHIHEGGRDHEDSIDAVEGRSQAARSRHVALDDLYRLSLFEPPRLRFITHQNPHWHALADEFVGYE